MKHYRIHPRLIARIIKAMKVNQSQFAAKLSVTRETVNRWLHGTQRPLPKHIHHLANLYNKHLHAPPTITP